MTTLPEAFLRVPIAHRALHDVSDGRPENSRAAIRAAIDHGYGIEVDLQLSRDGQAIVFHDYDMGRLTGRVPMLIELKDQHGQMGETDGRLERAVAAALEGYAGDVALMSFNPRSVVQLKTLCPDVARGIVTCGYPEEDWPLLRAEMRAHLATVPDYDEAGASFISHEVIDLGAPRVAELKAAGAHVLCWTVRSPAQEAEARRVAENITFERYLPAFPG